MIWSVAGSCPTGTPSGGQLSWSPCGPQPLLGSGMQCSILTEKEKEIKNNREGEKETEFKQEVERMNKEREVKRTRKNTEEKEREEERGTHLIIKHFKTLTNVPESAVSVWSTMDRVNSNFI